MAGDAAIERFAAMGTRVELHLFAPPATGTRDALSEARRAVAAVDDALTIHRPSPAVAVNEALLAGEIAHLDDPILFDAVALCDRAQRELDGLFDVAADARTGGDWSSVSFDAARRTLAASRPLALDFGGIGKGIALDNACAVLRDAGVRCALLSAGESSLAVIGAHPLGGGWPFTIPHPATAAELATVELDADEALSISATIGAGMSAPERAASLRPGDAFVTAPRTTVAIASSAAWAEALSTALLVAPEDAAAQLVAADPTRRYRFGHEPAMSGQTIGMLV